MQKDLQVFARDNSPGLPTPNSLFPVSVYLRSLVAPSCILLAEWCSILLAAKLIACQGLVQVWPCTDKRRGSTGNGRKQRCSSQTEQTKTEGEEEDCTARKMGHCVKNQRYSPIYQNLFSKQFLPKERFPSQAQQWTADSLVLRTLTALRGRFCHGTQRQTSKEKKTLYAKRDTRAREKWYNPVHCSATQNTAEQRTI